MEYIEFCEKLKTAMKNFVRIDLKQNQCQSFFDYMTLLLEKNKVMDLTTIDEPDEVIMRHFVDSCMANKFYNFTGKKVLDIGTGAGFPGLPLAIINEDAKFMLTDTLGKRISFLNEVVEALNIKNVELVKARAEDFDHDKMYREKFDYVVARAVANLSTLSEYCLPAVKIGGKFLSYKMDDCEKELCGARKAFEVLGAMFHVKHSYDLIKDEPKRCIIEIKKIKATPNKYPRKAGTPSREPIGLKG